MFGTSEKNETAARCRRLADKSWTAREKRRNAVELIGPMSGRTGLCIGGLGGALVEPLTATGGSWSFAELSDEAAGMLAQTTGGDVHAAADNDIPFEDGGFDVVLVTDRLLTVADSASFIAECHRVLKAGGRLCVVESHRKSFSLIGFLRRMAGVTHPDHPRPGYTQQELYHLVKDGFDVRDTRTFMRFGAALVDLLTRRMAGLAGSGEPWEVDATEAEFGRIYRAYSLWFPFVWLAALLDHLLFLSAGHCICLDARRRIWKPRSTPRLRDGRSIADATINTKIGTAAPF